MVKLAIAGASGEVAREIFDALIDKGRHRIVLLSRNEASSSELPSQATWRQVDYSSTISLTDALQDVHTVFSFITTQTDHNNQAQKNLIDASVKAGVKRFAPSEWVTSSFEHMPWYAGKGEIQDYLAAVNRDDKVLEYCLFQPGLFLNYFTHPHKSAKHVNTFQTQIDFENKRAIVAETFETDIITLTTAQNLAAMVVKAVDYEGVWPVIGGIQGCNISVADLICLGEQIRGDTFSVEFLEDEDLKRGDVKSTWLPKLEHHAMTPGQAEQMAGMFLAGMTLGISAGALAVSNEWNRIFPDFVFTQPREYLEGIWKGKA